VLDAVEVVSDKGRRDDGATHTGKSTLISELPLSSEAFCILLLHRLLEAFCIFHSAIWDAFHVLGWAIGDSLNKFFLVNTLNLV
jgi:hypothetical protein